MNVTLYFVISTLCCLLPDMLFAGGGGIVSKAESVSARHWADSVCNILSERERAAQLVVAKIDPSSDDATKRAIRQVVEKEKVGGLLFSKGTMAQHAEAADYARSLATVPLLITLDGEWGLQMRMTDAPAFPRNMALGAIADVGLMYEYGLEMADECRSMGINVNFAPVLDVNSNPDNPVIGTRSYGENPCRVSALSLAYARGLEDGGVQAVAKHFPGHGDTGTDSHKTLPVVDHTLAQLDSLDLYPFRRYISDGLSGIMVGHLSVPALDASGMAASLSPIITGDLLCGSLGFRGLVYTDALGMKGADLNGVCNSVAALNAGADVLLNPEDVAADIDAVLATVPADVIERKCKKILAYKYALGLSADNTRAVGNIDTAKAEALARRLTAAAVTCLWNRHSILPIKDLESTSIAVVCVGMGKDNKFAEYCRRYARVDVYDGIHDLSEINRHDVVIAAISSARADEIAGVARLKGRKGLVAAFLTSPYMMVRYGAHLKDADAVILAYDDTELARIYVAQAVFGGIDVDGRLPVNLPGIAAEGDGVMLHKTRLGYSVPSLKGLRPELTDSIDSILTDAVARGAFPGCQILVAKDGDVVIDRQYGRLTASGRSVDFTSLYDLASVSKAVGTLPGIMKVYDLGLLDISAPISQYIPGLKGVERKDSITARMLLHHESGLPPSLNMFDLMMDPASYSGKLITSRPDREHSVRIYDRTYGHRKARMRSDIVSRHRTPDHTIEAAEHIFVGRDTYDTIMQRIYHAPLAEHPTYVYSCLNFCLLMDMEQRITGIPHQQWVADSIWAPLGAWTMTYSPAERFPVSDIAATERDTYLRKQHVRRYVHDELAAFSGGVQGNAGVFANAGDIAKLCQMWLNGGEYGGRRILSKNTVRLFTTERSLISRRGLGFDKPDKVNEENSPTCTEAPGSVYGHLGFTGTVFWVDPDNGLIFVFLCNRVDPTRDNEVFSGLNLRPELFRQVYKAL